MKTFLDGNNLCADCGLCCTHVKGMKVTDEELARVPKLLPHVTRREGPFSIVDIPDGCPYLLPNGLCGTFATRPFDCSLYPVELHQLTTRPSSEEAGTSEVVAEWRYGGTDCPERWEFASGIHHGSGEQWTALREWVARASGASNVTLRQDPRQRASSRLGIALHRAGVLPVIARTLARLVPRRWGEHAYGQPRRRRP